MSFKSVLDFGASLAHNICMKVNRRRWRVGQITCPFVPPMFLSERISCIRVSCYFIALQCHQKRFVFLSVDVHLFRYVGKKKVDERDKSPVPLSLPLVPSLMVKDKRVGNGSAAGICKQGSGQREGFTYS